jgi:hypothetical protein
MQSAIDQVQSIAVADIAMVKVFRPPFFGAMGGGAGGAIAVYTRKGADSRKGGNSKGLEILYWAAIQNSKNSIALLMKSPITKAVKRITEPLYWNPYVITNKKSPRVRIQFFNNDISKKLQVVLEGINGEGKMTRVVKIA